MSQPVSFEIHTTYELPVSYSKTGLPCIWESGGGYTSRGDVVLVGGINGERLRPLYIRTRGSLACELARVVHPGGKIAVMHNYVVPKISGCEYEKIIVILTRIKQYPKIVTVQRVVK